MDKPQPIKQPTDSRIRPLSDYTNRIEIRGIEHWVSGTIQEFLGLTDEEMAEIEQDFQMRQREKKGKPMLNHTPGPWTVDGVAIRADVAHLDEDVDIARVYMPLGMTLEEHEANAKLISLAPEMYEICRLIAKDYANYMHAQELAEKLIDRIEKGESSDTRTI